MKNFKVGDKVKSRETGVYGEITDVDVSPNRTIVSIRVMLTDTEIYIPKSILDYVTPDEWEFVKRMEERD